MQELGWIEGQNLSIEARFAQGKVERLSDLASELVALPVDVLVTGGTQPALALKNATRSVPIVVAVAGDPAGSGLVSPGGNVAAFDIFPSDAAAKQLAVLQEVLPGLTRLAVLWISGNPAAEALARRAVETATMRGLQVTPIEVRDTGELYVGFADARDKRAQAIFVVADPRLFTQRKKIGELTAATGMPTFCQERDFGDAGCVIAYGANVRRMYRQAASYVAQIFKGAKPGDLQIGQGRFELVIHLGAAKALGLTIPESVLKRADSIIE